MNVHYFYHGVLRLYTNVITWCACACNIVYICSAWVQTYCYSQFWFCLPSNLPCVWTEAND